MSLVLPRRSLLLGGAAALAGCALRPTAAADGVAATGFTHGVASGAPAADAVTLWTRYRPRGGGAARLSFEVAADEAFATVIARGEAEAGERAFWCARARVAGLPPGAWLHYRFRGPDGALSPAGRTRTLPAAGAGAQRWRVAVFSCSNGTSGWFNAYAHAAARDDIDLALHLGDYIYESPLTRPDASAALALARGLAPAHETLSLADYRARYASYRADPDLAELHRRLPMIAAWDDHETANNSWMDGASGHDPATEGDWRARRDAGVRAFREWLPMEAQPFGVYRIGDLATLHVAETRLEGRTRQLDLDAVAAAPDPAAALDAFRKGPLADPARTILGAAQERWLAEGLAASAAAGVRWQVLAQQVVMAPIVFPAPAAGWLAPSAALAPQQAAEAELRRMMASAGFASGMDRWDGYPAARARLLAAARQAGANLVVLSGDSHNAWASDLAHEGSPAGVEFAGQSVSSFGVERRWPAADPGVIAAAYRDLNPRLRWCDVSQRGYFVLDIAPDRVEAEFVFVPAGETRAAAATSSARLTVERGAGRLG
jgi:alkaline phosphatase D